MSKKNSQSPLFCPFLAKIIIRNCSNNWKIIRLIILFVRLDKLFLFVFVELTPTYRLEGSSILLWVLSIREQPHTRFWCAVRTLHSADFLRCAQKCGKCTIWFYMLLAFQNGILYVCWWKSDSKSLFGSAHRYLVRNNSVNTVFCPLNRDFSAILIPLNRGSTVVAQ